MISIFMSVCSASNLITKAIESILNQTIQDYEFIMINDKFTDNTVEIIQTHLGLDNHIRPIQTNRAGISQARNIGMNAAQYPRIAIYGC